ncbi:MAG: hypothetical protein RL141_220 [Candidatus Parcubacteria bacterium]|jgi:hypothetical protein
MKRHAPLFGAVLLGAVATAIGMGIFLQLANNDRSRLSREINHAREAAAQALAEKERIASEANDKVEAANAEVEKAQRVLELLEEEQQLLTHATRLPKPTARELRGWTPVVSLPLAASLMIPPNTAIAVNDAFGLRAVTANGHRSASGTTWLSLTPYSPEQESSFPSQTEETSRLYVVDDHLLIGGIHTMIDGSTRAFFRIQQSASSTHLLELRDIGIPGNADGFERMLGTLEFGS